MSDETQPNEPAADAVVEIEPAPPSFDEWFERVQKIAQMHGQPIPEADPTWREAHAAGWSPFEAWNA